MSTDGATTGEGEVRTLWIGDLVRIEGWLAIERAVVTTQTHDASMRHRARHVTIFRRARFFSIGL